MIRERQDLIKMMRNKKQRSPSISESTKLIEESGYLLRRQDRRRLIEDQNLCVATEQLEDFDLLAGGHRKITQSHLGTQRKPKFVDSLLYPQSRFTRLETAKRTHWLDPQHHVFPDREFGDLDQFLMDHADPGSQGILRIADRQAMAVEGNDTGVGMLEAVEHLHQSALASAVLADDGMDLTAITPH